MLFIFIFCMLAIYLFIYYSVIDSVKYRKLAEEELKTNILSTETYQLPTGEEVERENILSAIVLYSE